MFSPVCDKRFNRPSSLVTHMHVHTGDKRKSPSREHEVKADSEVAYQCSQSDCGKKFSVCSNLRRHERVSGLTSASMHPSSAICTSLPTSILPLSYLATLVPPSFREIYANSRPRSTKPAVPTQDPSPNQSKHHHSNTTTPHHTNTRTTLHRTTILSSCHWSTPLRARHRRMMGSA